MCRVLCDWGGWEKAFGCGVKAGSCVMTPSAVAFSSSSSLALLEDASSDTDDVKTGGLMPSESWASMFSLELDMIRSDSLSLSSYSS